MRRRRSGRTPSVRTFTVQGLWDGPFLREVHGLSAISAGNVLLVAVITYQFGMLALGPLDRLLIVAWHDPKTQLFTIPTPSGPVRLHNMENFVTVRGGGYFFLPSRSTKAAVRPEPSRRPQKAPRPRRS